MFGAYKPLVLGGAIATAAALGAARVRSGGLRRCRSRSGSACSDSLPAYIPVLIAHGRSLLPPHLVGRGMTLFNVGTIGGVFVAQFVTGTLIDLFPRDAGVYPLEAYRLVFGFQAVLVLSPARSTRSGA